MNPATPRNHLRAPRRLILPAMLLALLGMPGWTGTARAEFTCSSNADCTDLANQCDPGRTPCNDGVCDPGSPDANATGCVLIPNDDKCNDDLFCNGTATCNPKHGCNDVVLPDCEDNVACTADACDESLKKCTHTKKNSMCSNGLFCDGREICDATEGCIPGTPPNCNDGVTCTVDVCDEDANACVNTPNNASCNDGKFCDGTEVCDAQDGCVPATAPNCDDHIACTTDLCVEASKSCTHTPSNASCSDGLFCDGVEVCSPTQGCQAGPPPNCNDGVACTADACVEASDTCSHVPNGGLCSNGQFCDGDEVCSPTKGCIPGTAPVCSDNIDCTADTCVEASDTCLHSPRNAFCSDGQFCNGVEICSPTLDCQAGTPPNCNDNISCTADSCVEASDTCKHTPNNGLCSDGLFCDGDEFCSPTKGCQPAPPVSCADAIQCTIDTCNETTNTCDHTASDDICNNNLFCDGDETCSPFLGCLAGNPVNCNDNIPCTFDTCVEQTDECSHAPDDLKCNDNLFCNGVETCDDLLGCVPGTPPNCVDNFVCTTDSCSEGTDSCRHLPNNSNCGDGVVDVQCGEKCDPDDFEICNNGEDDDGDTLIDCADPDCADALVPTCSDTCTFVPPCVPLRRDPAVISFDTTGERSTDQPGSFAFHARLIPTTPINPMTDGFIVTLSNANGVIYRADLKPADLESTGPDRVTYRSSNIDTVRRDGGIARLSIHRRTYGGAIGFGFRVLAYGDFSAAVLPLMTTQVYFGDDVGYVTATWTGAPGRWTLHQKDYDGVP